MKEITVAFFTATTVMCLVVVPFTIFYYEGEEDSDNADGSSKCAVVTDRDKSAADKSTRIQAQSFISSCLRLEMVVSYYNPVRWLSCYTVVVLWDCRRAGNWIGRQTHTGERRNEPGVLHPSFQFGCENVSEFKIASLRTNPFSARQPGRSSRSKFPSLST